MAANFDSQPRVPPTEAEGFQFAKQLYTSIWEKFRIVLAAADLTAPSSSTSISETNHPNHVVFRAVICEQLLLRDFLKNHVFVFKRELVLGDLQFVHLLCEVISNYSHRWDFFKRLTRCTAVIAEIFLFRFASQIDEVQLERAPTIWNVVFRHNFADKFSDNQGWDGWTSHCANQYSSDLYFGLDDAISQMRHPMDEIPLSSRLSIPELESDPTRDLYLEMRDALSGLGDHFKKKDSPTGEAMDTDSAEVSLPSSATSQSSSGPIPDLQDLPTQMSSLSSSNSNGINGVNGYGKKTLGLSSCAITLNILPPTPKVSPEEEQSMTIEQPDIVNEEQKNADQLVNPEQSIVGHPVNLEQSLVGHPVNLEQSLVGHPVKLEQPLIGQPVNLEQPLVGQPVNLEQPLVGQPVNLEQPSIGLPVNLEQPLVGQPVNPEQPLIGDQPVNLEQPMIEDSVVEPSMVSSSEQVLEANVPTSNLEEPESNRSPTSSHSSGGSPESRTRKRSSSKILDNPEEPTSSKYLKSD